MVRDSSLKEHIAMYDLILNWSYISVFWWYNSYKVYIHLYSQLTFRLNAHYMCTIRTILGIVLLFHAD